MKYELHTNIKNCVSVYVVRSLDDLKHKILWGKKICFLTGELNPLTSYEPGLSYIYIFERRSLTCSCKRAYTDVKFSIFSIFYSIFFIIFILWIRNVDCATRGGNYENVLLSISSSTFSSFRLRLGDREVVESIWPWCFRKLLSQIVSLDIKYFVSWWIKSEDIFLITLILLRWLPILCIKKQWSVEKKGV